VGTLFLKRSKSNGDFGCSFTGASDIIERLTHFLEIWRFTAPRLDNHVAAINSDTETNAPVFRLSDLHSSANRFYRAREFRQETVAGVLHDAPAMFRNCWGDSVRQERCQFGMRRLFVMMHGRQIASHVGGQYRRQLALYPDRPLVHY
jgi:hypothetical protein